MFLSVWVQNLILSAKFDPIVFNARDFVNLGGARLFHLFLRRDEFAVVDCGVEVVSRHAVIVRFNRRGLLFHLDVDLVLHLHLLNILRYFIDESFFAKNVRCWLAFGNLRSSHCVLV